jgi:hypothetical protein
MKERLQSSSPEQYPRRQRLLRFLEHCGLHADCLYFDWVNEALHLFSHASAAQYALSRRAVTQAGFFIRTRQHEPGGVGIVGRGCAVNVLLPSSANTLLNWQMNWQKISMWVAPDVCAHVHHEAYRFQRIPPATR